MYLHLDNNHNISQQFSFRYVKSVSQPASLPASSLPRKNKMKKATQEKRQERKAAKTLSAILLVFILTWTPYNVLAVMKGILGPEQSEVILNFSLYWLRHKLKKY